jgi:hypothetical protein
VVRRKRKAATVTVTVGANTVLFNKAATRWLGVWLDSQLTLPPGGRRGAIAMTRLRSPHWADGAVSRQLQKGNGSMRPVSRDVRRRAVVER